MKRLVTTPILVFGLLVSFHSAQAFDAFEDGGSHVVDSASPDIVVADGPDSSPTNVTIVDGASIGTDEFDVSLAMFDGSTVEIQGGYVENDLNASDSSALNISGGILDDDLQAFDDSLVTLAGGSLTDDAEAEGNSRLTITGGSVGEDIEAFDNATIIISGGLLGAGGGPFDSGLGAFDSSAISLFGSGFSINGASVELGLIAELSGSLAGTLADGNTFNLPFVQDNPGQIALFAPVPEPNSLVGFLLGCSVVTALGRRRRIWEFIRE